MNSFSNSSNANNADAKGVFEAAPKTATIPIPAKNGIGRGMIKESELPSVAPIKNNGVTSPPLKPTDKEIIVSDNFMKKA